MPLPTHFFLPHTNGRSSVTVAASLRTCILLESSRGISVNCLRSMGLLDKLWDDTVAGPRPETGLGRLRKHSSFGSPSNSGKERAAGEGGVGGSECGSEEAALRVTRSIMIKRPAGCPSQGNATPPVSPAGSTPPISPFSGGEWNRFRRKALSDAYDRRAGGGIVSIGSRDPTP